MSHLQLHSITSSDTNMFLFVCFLFIIGSCLAFLLHSILGKGSKTLKPPGPKPWPILGSLHLLGQKCPFAAFSDLSRQYGEIFSIRLGNSNCVVVNTLALIKEVLITKGAHFGGRLDLLRYHQLFDGDRNNSMALCDWSDVQKKRRHIARVYCLPRFTTDFYEQLNHAGVTETKELLQALSECQNVPIDFKTPLLKACGNIFINYMCSTRFDYNDKGFSHMIRRFDDIFWEIHKGYAVDFLPWLSPLYKKHMKTLATWSNEVRTFISERIIDEQKGHLTKDQPPKDFTEALLSLIDEDPDLSRAHILFELEDFIGAASAIGNLTMIILAAIVKHPHIAKKIQSEVDNVIGKREIDLYDRTSMPYTEAVILEALRTSSSPIVPHVATEDTSVAGFTIEKGTVVFLNNYQLNTGTDYWSEPDQFRPERFISPKGIIAKPAHFIPFSLGKRTCIGQKLVQSLCFLFMATLLQQYDIHAPVPEEVVTYPACIALPPKTFQLLFTPRQC